MKQIFTLSILLAIGLIFIACEKEKSTFNALTFKEAKQKLGKEPLVLEIGSSSCASCIKMKRIIDEVKAAHPTAPIYLIDVYEDIKVFKHFNLQAIPTQIAFDKNGKEVYRHVGILRKDALLAVIKRAQAN
jgi:thioredoxin 1